MKSMTGFGRAIAEHAGTRVTAEVRVLEPWVWVLFGLAAIPSVAFWTWLGKRTGIMNAFAAACIIEALGVAASVEWVTISGVCFSALILGGTFMGLTALGFMAARMLSAARRSAAWRRPGVLGGRVTRQDKKPRADDRTDAEHDQVRGRQRSLKTMFIADLRLGLENRD